MSPDDTPAREASEARAIALVDRYLAVRRRTEALAKPFKDGQLLQRVGRLLRRAPARPVKSTEPPTEGLSAVQLPIDEGPEPFLL